MNEVTEFDKLRRAIVDDDVAALDSAIAAGFNINSKDYHGRTLLMFAAEACRLALAHKLIAAKAKLDVRDQMNFHDGGGKTALHRAVASKCSEIVDALIAAGAKIDVADKLGETPLALAVANKDILMAEELLKTGANPDGSGRNTTPLSTAVALQSVEAVRLLLAYNANPNHPANAHSPVLASAAFWGPLETCRLLLEAGARVDAKDSDGKTALDGITKKPIDPRAWKILPPTEIEKLERSIEQREQIRELLMAAEGRLSR